MFDDWIWMSTASALLIQQPIGSFHWKSISRNSANSDSLPITPQRLEYHRWCDARLYTLADKQRGQWLLSPKPHLSLSSSSSNTKTPMCVSVCRDSRRHHHQLYCCCCRDPWLTLIPVSTGTYSRKLLFSFFSLKIYSYFLFSLSLFLPFFCCCRRRFDSSLLAVTSHSASLMRRWLDFQRPFRLLTFLVRGATPLFCVTTGLLCFISFCCLLPTASS